MKKKGQRAFALVIVTGIITFLGALIAFNSIDINLGRTWVETIKMQRKAYYMALAGVEAARALLKNDSDEDREQGRRVDFITSELDPNEEVWSHASEIPIPMESSDGIRGTVGGVIVDETSKINLNMLVGGDGRGLRFSGGMREHPRVALVKRFFEIMGIEPRIVDNIIDWIDEDSEGIAESDYYLFLEHGYEAKNAPMDTITELLLIKDIDDTTFLKLTAGGTQEARNDPMYSPYLTVYPRIQPVGGYTINVNTAPAEVLMSLLEGIDEEVAQDIINRRQEEPFMRPGEFIRYLDEDLGLNLTRQDKSFLSEIVGVHSNYFSAKVSALVEGYSCTIRVVLERDAQGDSTILYWRVE